MGLRAHPRFPAVVVLVLALTAVLGGRSARGNVASPARRSAAATVQTLTVAVQLAGNGASVTSSPAGISCPTACSASFPSGQTVALTVMTLPGLGFTGWSGGGCSGFAMTCSVVMSEDQSVSASFSFDSRPPPRPIEPASPGSLHGDAVGGVRFGLPKAEAVDDLTVLFGPPTWRGVNPGCGGPRWSEVLWDDLAAEFRRGRFSGYRYAAASHIDGMFGASRALGRNGVPRLATATGVSLGSTLAQVRAAYPRALRFAGTDKHKTRDGIVFVDNALHSPASLSSRIVEIKTFHTCGDF